MSREIPEIVRAAAGLAATVVDEARKLPETLPGLPVRVIGLAMQQAMKVQQHYAGLVARGDELFTGLRGENEPGLATFDDEVEPEPSTGYRGSAFDRAEAAPTSVEEVPLAEDDVEDAQQSIQELSDEAPGTDEILDELAIDEMVEQAPTLAETAPIDGYDGFSIAQLRGRLRGYAHSTVQELLAYEETTRSREPYLRMLRNRLEKLDEQAVEASPLAPRGA